MKAQKLRGRERRNSENILLMVVALFIFLMLQPLKADTIWTEGYHEINDGDVYSEIWMYNDATADMFGGDVFQLGALDWSIFNMFEGTMDRLLVRHSSLVNIHGGDLGHLVIYDENGLVNLYAYDVAYHPTGGGEGWMDGKYLINDQYFNFDVREAYISHINIVPEPATLLLLALGFLGIRRRN